MRYVKYIFLFFLMYYYSFAQRQNPESFLNHKVKKTESLEDLTKKYKLTEKEIIFYNPLIEKVGLKRRMILKIPVYNTEILISKSIDTIKYKIHKVKPKDIYNNHYNYEYY